MYFFDIIYRSSISYFAMKQNDACFLGTQRAARNHMYTTYWGDGNGRDSYVLAGNGGGRRDPVGQSWVSHQD